MSVIINFKEIFYALVSVLTKISEKFVKLCRNFLIFIHLFNKIFGYSFLYTPICYFRKLICEISE